MNWENAAQTLLDAATADVQVDRKLIAPGPDFAHDCRQMVVHLEQSQTRPVGGDLRRGCAVVPIIVLRVTFVADCVPTLASDGTPPHPEEITAWSKRFIADCQRVYMGIAEACGGGGLGDCQNVTIGDSTPTGPSGQTASMSWPVTIRNYI
ncbi:MAG TPA: hypothetical protein VIL36_06805 [Acidimicrobiales bacterium]|jgi:hypothetical protein